MECGKERGGESLLLLHLLVLDVLLLLDIHLLEREQRGDQGAGRPREDGHLFCACGRALVEVS